MRKYFYIAVAAMAALSSCSSESTSEEMKVDGKADVFTATIDKTRTTLDVSTTSDKGKVYWAIEDQISVNGYAYKATEGGSTTAIFEKMTDAAPKNGSYTAYYPADLYNGGTPTLPSSYTYEAGKFNMPMFAESTSTTLAFKNICGVLAITVTSSDMATVRKIKVTSDKVLCGAFSISDNKAIPSVTSDEYKMVILDCGSKGVATAAEGTTFYIAVPAQTYNYFNIYLSADGTTYKEVMATKKAAGLGEIARNKIFSIAYKKNAVKLWADSPYWSITNIGVTTETDYGQYFAWGYAEGCVYKNSGWVLASDNTTGKRFDLDNFPKRFLNTSSNAFVDAATSNWGIGWKMPTADNFRNLIDGSKTMVSYSNGVRISGKAEGYTSYSIFLPTSGYTYYDTYYQGNQAHYWSITEGSERLSSTGELYRAYYLGFRIDNDPKKNTIEVNVDNKYYGLSVRSVLKN